MVEACKALFISNRTTVEVDLMQGWGFDKHLDIDKLCLYFQGIRSFLYVHQLRDVAKKSFLLNYVYLLP